MTLDEMLALMTPPSVETFPCIYFECPHCDTTNDVIINEYVAKQQGFNCIKCKKHVDFHELSEKYFTRKHCDPTKFHNYALFFVCNGCGKNNVYLPELQIAQGRKKSKNPQKKNKKFYYCKVFFPELVQCRFCEKIYTTNMEKPEFFDIIIRKQG